MVITADEYDALKTVEASLRAVVDLLPASPYRNHGKDALARLDEVRG